MCATARLICLQSSRSDCGVLIFGVVSIRYASNIVPGSVVLGADDFNGAGGSKRYLSRKIAEPTNHLKFAWGEWSRSTLRTADILDTSLFQANGSPGDRTWPPWCHPSASLHHAAAVLRDLDSELYTCSL